MPHRTYLEFKPSHKEAPGPECRRIGDVPAGEPVEVSIYLKPRDSAAALAADGGRDSAAAPAAVDSRAGLAARRQSQHAADFELVRRFANEHGLTVAATRIAYSRSRI